MTRFPIGRLNRRYFSCGLFLVLSSPSIGWAGGPPFFTDDPVPVDHLHWEFYIASSQAHARRETDATFPHLEINCGAYHSLQLHIIAPMGNVRTDMGAHYGFGNVEIGAKYRFLEESERVPHIGTFVMLEIPPGSMEKQLSNGRPQIFFPLWLQKSWGKLTACGGGGFWFNPGDGMRNWIFLSEGIQKFLFPTTLGAGRFAQIGIPAPEIMAPFVGIVEIVFGILILIGFITRLATVPLLIDIVVAIITTKIPLLLQKGFWAAAHEARVDIAMLLGLLFLFLSGAGSSSIDARSESRRQPSPP